MLSHDELIKLVGQKLKSKWYKIGQQLGIHVTTLREISASTESWDTYSRLEKVFLAWKDSPSDDNPYTWGTILNNEKVYSRDIAAEVDEYFLKGGSVGMKLSLLPSPTWAEGTVLKACIHCKSFWNSFLELQYKAIG